MSEINVRKLIMDFLSEKPVLKDISPDQDFFDVGASSLTIVDLQIQLEEKLKKEVPTATLMSNPTVDGWVSAYAAI
jgi:acyl carrier protein